MLTLLSIALTFTSLCAKSEECQLRRKIPSKGVVVKPIVSKDFNSWCQVDLVDMQSMPGGKYRFIMNYQDHLTKFCIIEDLSSKRAAEVAYKILLNIFLYLVPLIFCNLTMIENSHQKSSKNLKCCGLTWQLFMISLGIHNRRAA